MKYNTAITRSARATTASYSNAGTDQKASIYDIVLISSQASFNRFLYIYYSFIAATII